MGASIFSHTLVCKSQRTKLRGIPHLMVGVNTIAGVSGKYGRATFYNLIVLLVKDLATDSSSGLTMPILGEASSS